MAAKKGKRGVSTAADGGGSKKSFILGFAPDTPAADVVAAGKAKGMNFSTAYVYVLRSKAGTPAARKRARAAGGAPSAARGGKGPEGAFIDLALELGLSRATELLARVRQRARSLSG